MLRYHSRHEMWLAVNLFDLATVLIAIVFALWGFQQGAITGFFSLAGFALGALVAVQIALHVVPGGARSAYVSLIALVLAAGIGTFAAEIVGSAAARLSSMIPGAGLQLANGMLGGAIFVVLALSLAWLLAAAALRSPVTTQLRSEVQKSAILRALNKIVPPSRELLNALGRIDPLPELAGPSAPVGAPDPKALSDPDVRGAGASVVRILGTACGLGVEGSGWVVSPRMVVTNAHVISGQSDTTVQQDGNGFRLPARAVTLDVRNDLALLYVPDLDRPALRLVEEPEVGAKTVILGYPRNGPFDARPARVGPTRTVASRDAYGRGPVPRTITAFRGVVRQGNSGGPLVDTAGRVQGTIFAATVGGRQRGGYSVPPEIIRAATRRANPSITVSTGPCS